MSAYDFEIEEAREAAVKRKRLLVIWGVIGAFAAVGIVVWMMMPKKPSKPSNRSSVTMVNIPPPPPPPRRSTPPPTPPPQEQPREDSPEDEMVMQDPVAEDEPAPSDAPEPAESIGTGITGDGPADGFGLSGKGGGMRIGGGGGRGGSKFGWYASQVQKRVASALRSNPATRTADMSVVVRIWADQTGRVTRASLDGTTGDASLDNALRNNILPGLQLTEAPPADMPMPIVMRVRAARP